MAETLLLVVEAADGLDLIERDIIDLVEGHYRVEVRTGSNFRTLVDVARMMLNSVYPEDLFGHKGPFNTDPGPRFTQHLRDALAVLEEGEQHG